MYKNLLSIHSHLASQHVKEKEKKIRHFWNFKGIMKTHGEVAVQCSVAVRRIERDSGRGGGAGPMKLMMFAHILFIFP